MLCVLAALWRGASLSYLTESIVFEEYTYLKTHSEILMIQIRSMLDQNLHHLLAVIPYRRVKGSISPLERLVRGFFKSKGQFEFEQIPIPHVLPYECWLQAWLATRRSVPDSLLPHDAEGWFRSHLCSWPHLVSHLSTSRWGEIESQWIDSDRSYTGQPTSGQAYQLRSST